MKYIQTTLTKDENIIENIEVVKIIFKLYIIGSILFIWTLIGPIVYLYIWLSLKFSERVLTNRRIVVKTGIISRHTDELLLFKVETVEIRQGITARILGYGSIILTGTGSSSVRIPYVKNYIQVKQSIEETIEKNKKN